jgi:hypothetical protein
MKLPDTYRTTIDADDFLDDHGKGLLVEALASVYAIFAHDPVLDDETESVWF